MCSTSDLSSCDERDKSKESTKRFYCKELGCSASFSKNRKLINHIRKHKGERPFECTVRGCKKSYTNSSHLRRHIRSHTEDHKSVVCDVGGCGKAFYDQYSLKRHKYRLHNANRLYPFTCSECKQGFSKKNQLRKHSYLHTGILPFTCDVCKTGFTTQRDCNRHKRSHTRYTCLCGKTYERWSQLLSHRKVCLKTEFKCNTCLKVFSTERTLKYHEQIHMKEEDRDVFACNFKDCERYYFYKKNLVHHVNTFHKNIIKKIPCPVKGCKSTLSKMQNLRKHIDRMHEPRIKERKNRRIRKDAGTYKGSCVVKLTRLKLPANINSQISQNIQVDVDKLKRKLLKNKKGIVKEIESNPEDNKYVAPFNEDIIKKKFDDQLLIEDCLLQRNSFKDSSKNSKESKLDIKNGAGDDQNDIKEVVSNLDILIYDERGSQVVGNINNVEQPLSSENNNVIIILENDTNQTQSCTLCLGNNLENIEADLEYTVETLNEIDFIKTRFQNLAKKENLPKIMKITVKLDNSICYFCSCSFKS